MPKSCASKAGCSHSRVILKALSETFSPRSPGHAANRRKCGNCARRPASLGYGRAKVRSKTRMNCSPLSTAGSPKASTPRICWKRSLCSPNSKPGPRAEGEPMTQFGTWLAEIGLGRYHAVFASNEIDFDVIGSLTDADLRELGLALGDRKRLLRAVARLDEQRTADTVSPLIASTLL